MRILCDEQDSEDALQEGLLSAFRHLNQFEGRAQFTTWMHAIVVNAAKSMLRTRRSRPFVSSLDEPLPGHEDIRIADAVADPCFGVDDEYERREKLKILAETIEELPLAWRVVVQMCDFEGLQLKEVASRLGLSLSAVKTRHFRANRRILKVVKSTQARHPR